MMIVLWMLLLAVGPSMCINHQTPKLLHVMVSHKLYAPVENSTLPHKLNYNYFLKNTTKMPKEHMMSVYNVGVFLRKEYGSFLKNIYSPDIAYTGTTAHALSIISAQLVNAGLWPPAEEQIWNPDLPWQPIPIDYVPVKDDDLLLGTLQKEFLKELASVHENKTWITLSGGPDYFKNISEASGFNITKPLGVELLLACLQTIDAWNEKLPKWATPSVLDGLKKVSLLAHDMLSFSPRQKQLNGGAWLQHMIGDTEWHKKYQCFQKNKINCADRRLFMYSGGERNLIGILQALSLWDRRVLQSGASLIFEIHQDCVTTEYNVRMRFYNGTKNLSTLTLPGCTEYCPLGNFTQLLLPVLPDVTSMRYYQHYLNTFDP